MGGLDEARAPRGRARGKDRLCGRRSLAGGGRRGVSYGYDGGMWLFMQRKERKNEQ